MQSGAQARVDCAAVRGADDIARHPELAHDPAIFEGLDSRKPPTRRALLTHRLAIRIARIAVRRKRPNLAGGPAAVTILLISAHSAGGIVRSVMNLAAHLAEGGRDVEIVSIFRNQTKPLIPIPQNVRVTVLDDRRKDPPGGLRGWLVSILRRFRTRLLHPDDNYARSVDLGADIRLIRHLRRTKSTVWIATRPSFGFLLAQAAGSGVKTIYQEHMNLASRRVTMQPDIRRAVPKLDAVTVLTETDRGFYEAFVPSGRIVTIPNGVPAPQGPPSDVTSPIVIAAGRLTSQKGFDLLVRSYGQVAREEPEWKLKICGRGPLRHELLEFAREAGVEDHLLLPRHIRDMEREMERASLCVLSSRFEGLPLVLIEAMTKGLPIVAFDCVTGPADLLEPGVTGLIVPFGDLDGLAAAMLELIRDKDKRRRFGAAALERAQEYTLERVGKRWDELITELASERPPARLDLEAGDPGKSAERP
jgi:glycosyltransferase involved in cell wall biosynthesis